MLPASACRPTVKASALKGTCHWLSHCGGRVVVAALKYNFYRAVGRIFCRWIKYATGYCKWESGLVSMICWDSALCRSDSSLPVQNNYLFVYLQRRFLHSSLKNYTKCCEFTSPSSMSRHSLTQVRHLFFKYRMCSIPNKQLSMILSGLSCKLWRHNYRFSAMQSVAQDPSDASRTTLVCGGMSQLEIFVIIKYNTSDMSNDPGSNVRQNRQHTTPT